MTANLIAYLNTHTFQGIQFSISLFTPPSKRIFWGYLLTSFLIATAYCILTFIFFATGANLRHSHIPLGYPPALEKIFISPYQHQMHHFYTFQKEGVNFGSKLSIWDGLFNTLVPSKATTKI